MTVLANPTTGPRIVPLGETRKSSDVLSNGHPAFRVTQLFSSGHMAIDFANFFEGDPLLASLAGTIHNRIDGFGALITEIHTGRGQEAVGYGHLRNFGRPDGYNVVAGELIGYVGSTGLSPDGAHCHYGYYDLDGYQRDPWPLLQQNQETELPDTGTGAETVALDNLYIPADSGDRTFSVKAGTVLRVLPSTSAAIHYRVPVKTAYLLVGFDTRDGKRTGWVAATSTKDRTGVFYVPAEH